MKHGIKLRKLQRTPSHRWALLRNLVSALLHHETIKTTLPKAKETARLAEKIITLGKKGTDPAYRQAMAFLMPSHSFSPAASTNSPIPPPRPLGYPSASSSSSTTIASSSSASAETDPETFEPPTSILPKLFQTLSQRYADRPGGYTRIHRFGRRKGDNAPHAILELVDGPRDLKYEMVARAVGRERAQASASSSISANSVESLRDQTQENMSKVLRYRSDEDRAAFARKADEWAASLAAEEEGYGGHRRRTDGDRKWSERSRNKNPYAGRLYRAGEKLAGMSVAHSGLGLARGDLGRRAGLAGREPRFLNEAAP